MAQQNQVAKIGAHSLCGDYAQDIYRKNINNQVTEFF